MDSIATPVTPATYHGGASFVVASWALGVFATALIISLALNALLLAIACSLLRRNKSRAAAGSAVLENRGADTGGAAAMMKTDGKNFSAQHKSSDHAEEMDQTGSSAVIPSAISCANAEAAFCPDMGYNDMESGAYEDVDVQVLVTGKAQLPKRVICLPMQSAVSASLDYELVEADVEAGKAGTVHHPESDDMYFEITDNRCPDSSQQIQTVARNAHTDHSKSSGSRTPPPNDHQSPRLLDKMPGDAAPLRTDDPHSGLAAIQDNEYAAPSFDDNEGNDVHFMDSSVVGGLRYPPSEMEKRMNDRALSHTAKDNAMYTGRRERDRCASPALAPATDNDEEIYAEPSEELTDETNSDAE